MDIQYQKSRKKSKPRDHILGLDCGYPKPSRNRAPLPMLKGYFDASGKGAKDIFVIAGYISTSARWAEFVADWDAELKGGKDKKKRQRMKAFKLNNMNLKSTAQLRRCSIFNDIAHEHAIARVVCVVDVSAFRRVMKNSPWSDGVDKSKESEDVYWFAFRAITEAFQHERRKRRLKQLYGPIDFIFDQENKSDCAAMTAAWARLYAAATSEKKQILGNRPNFQRDDLVTPLQAADLAAGVARRIALTGQSIKNNLPTPWNDDERKPVLTITMEYGEKEIQRNLDKLFTKVTEFFKDRDKWVWVKLPEKTQAPL